MKAFEIKTRRSDYPFLVLAEGFLAAVEILIREKNVRDGDFITVQQLDAYKSDHILVKELILAEERLEEKVRQELAPKLPHWRKMPNGVEGGGHRHQYLIRSSRGNYFTAACVGDDCYYLIMDDLEQLPEIINPNEV